MPARFEHPQPCSDACAPDTCLARGAEREPLGAGAEAPRARPGHLGLSSEAPVRWLRSALSLPTSPSGDQPGRPTRSEAPATILTGLRRTASFDAKRTLAPSELEAATPSREPPCVAREG